MRHGDQEEKEGVNASKTVMTKTDFSELLKKHQIDINLVEFDDSAKDGYCVKKTQLHWEVFFRERGKEYDCIGFPSESDALRYLFEKLFSIYGSRS